MAKASKTASCGCTIKKVGKKYNFFVCEWVGCDSKAESWLNEGMGEAETVLCFIHRQVHTTLCKHPVEHMSQTEMKAWKTATIAPAASEPPTDPTAPWVTEMRKWTLQEIVAWQKTLGVE